MASPAAVDLHDYTAPFATLTPPSAGWVRAQTRKGAKGTTIPASSPLLQPAADLRGKWVLITGANNGIGREAALTMARWGANLVLGCRDAPAKEIHPSVVVEECLLAGRSGAKGGAEKQVIEWWEVDFADLASVERLAARWLATGRALDVLCNNAGMGSSPSGSSADVFRTRDGFEIIHQVNFLSHVLLTLRLLPALKAAPAPRVVCTTSCYHYPGKFDLGNFNAERGDPGLSGVQFYQNNKLWFQVWLTELQERCLRHDGYRHITVNGIHPGYVNTGVWNLNGVMDQGWKTWVVKSLAWCFAITPQQGSLAITHAVASLECGPDPEKQGVGEKGGKGGGRYFNRVWEEEPMPHVKDEDCRLRVWRKVNDELGLKDKGLLDDLGLWSTE